MMLTHGATQHASVALGYRPIEGPTAESLDDVRSAVWASLERGDVSTARGLIADARAAHATAGLSAPLADVGEWPDAWLVAAVRCEPPDTAALDALVKRFWRALYGRCRMLAQDAEAARDLAQETWVRVLRARHTLEPDGHVASYLVTIATNLWRDRQRARQRAGALADNRMASIEAEIVTRGGERVSLADAVPDADEARRARLAEVRLDLDRALDRLSPRARDLLTSRYLDGESAAEIGRRYGRTEQTITTWLRLAIVEMRRHLGQRATNDRARLRE